MSRLLPAALAQCDGPHPTRYSRSVQEVRAHAVDEGQRSDRDERLADADEGMDPEHGGQCDLERARAARRELERSWPERRA